MPKFNASKLTREDLEIIDSALTYYYGKEYEEKVLLVKRKIEWLLEHGGIGK